MKQSAGCLLYQASDTAWCVLIVHPSGVYNIRAPWSIPKGLVDRGETTEAAARRETLEETGITVGDLVSLGFVDMKKSRKRIHCYTGPLPPDAEVKCTSWEIDRAEVVPLDKARELLHPDQKPLIDRLEKLLESAG